MYDKNSRIYFQDSPYPKGHLLKDFQWTAHLDPTSGIWFHIHLETEDYDAEDNSVDPEEFDSDTAWESKIVWNNYHRCRISSNFWHHRGFLAGSQNHKIDFSNPMSFHVDKLPRPDDFDINKDPAFGIYLLGHDDCAEHKITFLKNANGNYDIDWSGKIALAYSGDYDFNYSFNAIIKDVEFGGLSFPISLTDEELQQHLKNYSINYQDIKLIK